MAVIAADQRASLGQTLGLAGIAAWAAVGYVAIDTSAAAVGANFMARHVQRATTLWGRTFGSVVGALFSLATALAACRLILFATGAPASFHSPLAWEVAGLRPFGWPLVLLAATLAALTVLAACLIATDRLAGILGGRME